MAQGNSYLETALQMRGHQVAEMIHVAAQLGIADMIAESARPVAELAAEAGAQPDKLVRMLRTLAVVGIFAVDREGRVSHTEKSRHLRRDATPTLHYAARFWGLPSMWATWGKMEHTIRTGEPAFEAVYGMSNWAYFGAHPDEAQVFDEFMQHSPDDRQRAVAEAYDFTGARVVDVGGGNGGLLRAILEAHPTARGVLADQEAVVAAAPAALGPFIERCEVVPIDFFEAVPSGGDVYTMSQILHDWSDERCLTILRNCRAAMPGHGKLLVIERVLEEEPEKNSVLNLLGDMQMMALFRGAKERTLSEFAALLAAADFGSPRLIPTRVPFGIVEASSA
jgi:hypothetical protein